MFSKISLRTLAWSNYSMSVDLEVILPAAAALFGYLSWKRISMGSTLQREEVIRNRLKDSAGATNYYNYQLGRVQISEYGGWGYAISKYLPLIGGISGDTIVYLWFSLPVSGDSLTIPSEDEIRRQEQFQELPISSIAWKGEIEGMVDEGINLEIIIDSTDPDEILVSITELSGIMLEINSGS